MGDFWNRNAHVCRTKLIFVLPLSLSDKEADKEATEMLTDNAQNLMKVVSEVLYATEAASIRIPQESRGTLTGLTWIKR